MLSNVLVRDGDQERLCATGYDLEDSHTRFLDLDMESFRFLY